jgi:hypothetical protein
MSDLSSWAGKRKLFTANYFFWNSGKEMQKSQHGLLQSILCQILRSEPDLVTKLCLHHDAQEPWSVSELIEVFRQIQGATVVSAKFCFFIDGLDEYNGPEEKIVEVLNILTQSPHVKICTSSRPWLAFENAFGKSEHTLKVQDFTATDMGEYVRGMFGKNPEFNRIMVKDARLQILITEIVSRAKGVWLWVYLVVRDLTRDIDNQEKFAFIQKRLDAIPDKLEAYFEEIMGRIETIYKPEMAQIFLTTAASVRPLPLYALSLLNANEPVGMENMTPESDAHRSVGPVDQKVLAATCETLRIKVKTRCRDLITVQYDGAEQSFLRWSVDFLHRTVRDFLRKNYQSELYKQAPAGFNERVALCSMMVTLLRSYPISDFQTDFNVLIGFVDEFLYYAYELELFDLAETQFPLLDEIDYFMTDFAFRGNIAGHWTGARTVLEPTKYQRYHDHRSNFLSLAVQARLRHYVAHVLDKDPQQLRKLGRPLLDYALRPKRVTPIMLPYHADREIMSIDVDLISTLLAKGADPNERIRIFDDYTPIACFAMSCYENQNDFTVSSSDRAAWFSAAKLLVKSGGNLDARVSIQVKNTAPSPPSRQRLETEYSKPSPPVRTGRYKRAINTSVTASEYHESEESRPESLQKTVTVEEVFAMVFPSAQMEILRAEKRNLDGKRQNTQWSLWSLLGY